MARSSRLNGSRGRGVPFVAAAALALLALAAACGDGGAASTPPGVTPAQTQADPEDAPLLDPPQGTGDGDELAFRDIDVDGRVVRMWDILGRDAIPAIFDPTFIPGSEVGARLSDDELVIGVSINGEHHAYGVAFLSQHEVVNDVVGGVPIAVTWCPLCFTGVVYSRETDGQVLSFGVSGKLIRNSLVMYDRETGSLWSQFVGAAVLGRHAGAPLRPLASTFTDWSTWRDLHPDTLVLDQGRFPVTDAYGAYYRSPQLGIVGVETSDGRLGAKDEMLGVRLDDARKAYPFSSLARSPVVNDRLGETAVVVVFNLESIVAQVFRSTVDGRSLTFDPATERAPGVVLPMVDRETDTLWTGLTGEALSGPLAGARLEQLPSTPVFWFAWSDFYPQTEVWASPAAG